MALETSLKQLKYNQARLAILNLIAESNIDIGDRLPPERQLVNDLNCSSTTMRHALAVLETDGIIEKRHGLGSYLAKGIYDDTFSVKILFVSVIQKDENAPGAMVDRERHYLASRGLGMSYISVYECGLEMIEAAKECLGIILQGWLTDEFIQKAKMLKLPMIILGNNNLHCNIPSVRLDMVESAYRLTKNFINSGLKNVALFDVASSDVKEDYQLANEHMQGYVKAMTEARLPYENLIAPSMGRFHKYRQVDAFMKDRKEKLDAVIMEPAMFDMFIAWCWENDYPAKPKFGITMVLENLRGYHVTKNMYWGHFPGLGTIGARILVDHIVKGIPMQSYLVKPVIHGVDDNLTDFIS